MKEIKAIIRQGQLDPVLDELINHPNLPGLTISFVQGFGRRVGREEAVEINPIKYGVANLVKLECVVDDGLVDEVVSLIQGAAQTGMEGDGKITVSPVDEFVKIRTGQRAAHVV